jgi:hypothetical protein
LGAAAEPGILDHEWSPHRQEPVAPFKNATSREFRIPPPAGFQFAGIEAIISSMVTVVAGPVIVSPMCGSWFGSIEAFWISSISGTEV